MNTVATASAFDFKDRQVRAMMIDGLPQFVANDVCAVLALSNPRSSLALLDDDEKDVHTVDTLGGPQELKTVTEPGLYSLVFRSRRPEAKEFKRWVTHEVLPALRKTGSYSLGDVSPVRSIAAQPEIDRANIARAQIEMLGVAVGAGLLDKLWATSKTHIIAARVIGEEAELPAEEEPLYVPDFIKSKGVTKKKDITSIQSWFGIRVGDLCRLNNIEVPEKRPREQLDGTVRKTIAWRAEHLPQFEQVWETFYAAKYDRPMVLALDGMA